MRGAFTLLLCGAPCARSDQGTMEEMVLFFPLGEKKNGPFSVCFPVAAKELTTADKCFTSLSL